jgi:hypothetical protein
MTRATRLRQRGEWKDIAKEILWCVAPEKEI